MTDDARLPTRRSPRLQGFDYATPGFYFITICREQRAGIFGEFVGETLRLNAAGQMVSRWWSRVQEKFAAADCDAFVVMPDHVHGIIALNEHQDAERTSLSRAIAWFKTMTTNEYIRRVRDEGWPRFE
ncbi:MAG TPA: hypothetical protein VFY79_11060 [Dehalococcoidia bacterium]|nr:hypothetical protein [Dehalococcoidia bacterium]